MRSATDKSHLRPTISAFRPYRENSPIYPNDPADRPHLRRLVAKVISNPVHAAFLAGLNAEKPGVVLCGGGGKGAYQIGALLALFDLGLCDFPVIAGTSVGGLNAILLRNMVSDPVQGRKDALLISTES